jgi:hypothetical protein
MNFESTGSVAIDRQYDIEIYVPRILPGDGLDEQEYQYHVRVKGRSDGIGFFGTSSSKKVGDHQEIRSVLSLSPDGVLEWFLNLKRELAVPGDDYSFLVDFAHGLLAVFAADSSLFTNYGYAIQASEASLARLSVQVPPDAKRGHDGNLVLAELYVPCRGDAGSEG